MVLLSPEELEALVARAVAPLRAELAAMAETRRAEPVSLEEAARFYGVSVRTMRRKVKAGEVQAVRLGRSVRVRLDAAGPTR